LQFVNYGKKLEVDDHQSINLGVGV